MAARPFDTGHVLAGVAAALAVLAILAKPSKLDAIPTYGPSSLICSWWAARKFETNGLDVLQKGYEKFKSAPFKVATLFGWLVIVNDRGHMDELQRASPDTLVFLESLADRLEMDHTIGPEIHLNPYHVPILRSRFTRNLDALYAEIRDEITIAFDEVLDLEENEWKCVPALGSVQQVICRTSNRVFVGLPLCHHPDWIAINIRHTINVSRGSVFIASFPDVLKPIATRLFTNINQGKQQARELLGPTIEQRLKEYGHEWTDKPNDLLSWLVEEAKGPELTVESLTSRVLFINVAAIHTSSSSFGHVLFYLAANPQYIRPLREEVERIVEKEGWSKSTLIKMRKVDSFLRECQRITMQNCVSLQRKALKDFTFSDGTFVPKGTIIATDARSVHYDEAFYDNAQTFEPFRFVRLSEGDEGAKYQYVSTSSEYLPFGHGRQACPGRFFAAIELKTMLAHIVVTYDVKLADNVTRPQAVRFVTSNLPDPHAKVMFRRRVD